LQFLIIIVSSLPDRSTDASTQISQFNESSSSNYSPTGPVKKKRRMKYAELSDETSSDAITNTDSLNSPSQVRLLPAIPVYSLFTSDLFTNDFFDDLQRLLRYAFGSIVAVFELIH
jgi:hypothetical protein